MGYYTQEWKIVRLGSNHYVWELAIQSRLGVYAKQANVKYPYHTKTSPLSRYKKPMWVYDMEGNRWRIAGAQNYSNKYDKKRAKYFDKYLHQRIDAP